MRLFLTILFFAVIGYSASAQVDSVGIADIQSVPQTRLQNCDDAPGRLGDTVRFRAVVLTRGGIAQSASGRQIWVRCISGAGPFKQIGIRNNDPNLTNGTTPDDMLTVAMGDTVRITGVVQEFNGTGANPANDGESQISPLPGGFEILAPANPNNMPQPTAVNISQLADGQAFGNVVGTNILTTGEQFEGDFVEITNAEVVTVTNFGGSRWSFRVKDPAGNRIEISDRFLAGRLSTNTAGGTLRVPAVGDRFSILRGIIIHSKQCAGSGGANNRGYTLNPFDSSHYVSGQAAPAVTNITRSIVAPTSTQAVVISATITPGANNGLPATLTSATINWALGETGGTFSQAPMTQGAGNSWSGTIPAQANGSFVRFYITATNNANATVNTPSVPAPANAFPLFYTVRDNGLSIRDIQYNPYGTTNNAATGYAGQVVTVRGIVTASAEPGNLGFVYIQTPGTQGWGAIALIGGNLISNLSIGQEVEVTGTVEESNQMTRLTVSTVNVINATPNPVTPLGLEPAVLGAYASTGNNNTELYEAMLVTVRNGNSNPVFVVDSNTATGASNFGEWRIGNDITDPNTGTMVITGRQSTTAFSSLNCTYINSTNRGTTNGTLNPTLPIFVIRDGDRFTSITGIVYHSFNALKLMPRNNADVVGYIPSGILRGVSNKSFVAFPIPASSVLQLQAVEGANGNFKAQLMDMTGRVIRTAVVSEGTASFNLAEVKAGQYMVIVTDATGAPVYRNQVSVIR